MSYPQLSEEKKQILQRGIVIPALPLALDRNLHLDVRRQRALIRYYADAGVGGVAVGVHTTQFAIRDPQIGLFRPLLELAGEEINARSQEHGRPLIQICGISGPTQQAVAEARLAVSLDYDAGLLSLATLPNASHEELISHCREIARNIPLIGFYLQPAVGGRILDEHFWRDFAEIENVVAVKIAPFNRYHTLDVIKGIITSGRGNEIALYTGNDDNIVADLLTEYYLPGPGGMVRKRIVAGLLGHWAVWTRKAVELLERIHRATPEDYPALLSLGTQITDCNAAFFDAANGFKGVIAGIHEVLRRQGFFDKIRLLDPKEKLSPGQKEEIDRVYRAYPHLNDDDFVRMNLNKWLS